MTTEVKAAGGSVTVATTVDTVAADGDYRFGVFDGREPNLGGEVGNDVDRDGNADRLERSLRRPLEGRQVWVDANQNLSFADGGDKDYK